MVAAEAVPPLQEDDSLPPSLVIPITSCSTSNFVEIFPDELQEIPASALMQVLREEESDLSVWADASLMYIQQGHSQESCSLLNAACDLPWSNNRDARVRILASAGIAQLAQKRDDWRALADQRFTQSTKVDTLFPMQWIGRGMLNLSVGRMDQARFFFETTLKQCGKVLPALLGMAAVCYGEGHYQKALDFYGKAISLFPVKSGAATRVGFGLACIKLGQVDRAKASFARALQMDPENVNAMVASALLDMAAVDQKYSAPAEKRKFTEMAIKKISMANLLDHSNAMVQNHLANHYFWKWTPVVGVAVQVVKGSSTLKSKSIIFNLEVGERIRVGPSFETYIVSVSETDETVVTMKHVWDSDNQDNLKLWKRDYDRVLSLAKGAFQSTLVQEVQAESLLHQARVHHVREEWEQAHGLYEQACKLAPDLSPARFGLAQTLIEKEEYDQAAAHLRLVLGTCATATDALAALGLLECRNSKNFTEGLQYLKKAIALDPLNPELYLLEALALQQRKSEYPAALARYKKAVDLLKKQNKPISYEVYVNSGVLCHEMSKFQDALDFYASALETLDEDESTSNPTLENVGTEGGIIRSADNGMFCGHVDSSIAAKAPSGEDKTLIQVVGDNTSSLVKGDYIKLGDVLETQIEDILSENGVFSFKIAHELVLPETSAEGDEDDKTPDALPIQVKRENLRLKGNPFVVSVAFNIARLHEAAGRMFAAVELHKAIVKRSPTYTNSYLRLACIARDSGALKECTTWLQLSRMSSPDNNETLTLMGNLHLSLCDWPRAQSVFDSLLSQKVPNVEAYSMLSLGTIYFANLKTPKKYSKHLQYAADFYKRILSKDKTNIYAANGLGTILAEKGELFKAKQVFNRVREVSGDTIADAHVNLGHIYLAQKKHPESLQMYQSYMNKAQDVSTPVTSKSRKDSLIEILLYIGFAYFDWARQAEAFNDVRSTPADERYKKCMEHLELAMAKSERENIVLQYNYCMTKLQAANCVLQKLTRNIRRTAAEVEEALKGLEQSLPQVEQILQYKMESKKVLIPTSVLQDFITNCKANIESAKSHLDQERKKEEDAKAVREMQQWEAETQRKEREVQLLEKKAQEAKEQELREKKARANMVKLEQLQQGWQLEADIKKNKEDKKKKDKNPVPPEVEDEDAALEEQRINAADATAALFDDSDSDSDNEQPAEKKDEASKDDAMEEEPAVGADGTPAKGVEAATEKDLFGESSSEEEGDEEVVPPESSKKRAADEGETMDSAGDGEKSEEQQQPAKKRRVLDSDDEDE